MAFLFISHSKWRGIPVDDDYYSDTVTTYCDTRLEKVVVCVSVLMAKTDIVGRAPKEDEAESQVKERTKGVVDEVFFFSFLTVDCTVKRQRQEASTSSSFTEAKAGRR